MTFGFILLVGGIAALVAGIKGVTIAEILKGGFSGDNPIFTRGTIDGSPTADTKLREAYGDAAALAEPGSGKVIELFYDPVGAWKNGLRIPAIGGHDDHVHVAAPTSVVRRLQEIAASRFNLRITEPVGEDSGGHATNSYHKKRMAFDASGSPADMEAFTEFVRDGYVKKAAPRRPRASGHQTRRVR